MAGNLNSGKPRSEMDLADLERALERGYPIELIAGYVMRDAEEVRQMREALLASSIRLPMARRSPGT
jgi:hypothetical protein